MRSRGSPRLDHTGKVIGSGVGRSSRAAKPSGSAREWPSGRSRGRLGRPPGLPPGGPACRQVASRIRFVRAAAWARNVHGEGRAPPPVTTNSSWTLRHVVVRSARPWTWVRNRAGIVACWADRSCADAFPEQADEAQATPRFSRKVSYSYSVRKRPRRCNSATTPSMNCSSPSVCTSMLTLKPSPAPSSTHSTMSLATCSGVPMSTRWPPLRLLKSSWRTVSFRSRALVTSCSRRRASLPGSRPFAAASRLTCAENRFASSLVR